MELIKQHFVGEMCLSLLFENKLEGGILLLLLKQAEKGTFFKWGQNTLKEGSILWSWGQHE